MYHQRTQKNKTRQLDLFAGSAVEANSAAFRDMTRCHGNLPTAQLNDPLIGLAVCLPNDPCKCSSDIAVIGTGLAIHRASLSCRSCGRSRGWLPKFTADWIASVISLCGRPDTPIIIRGPRL